VYNDNLTRKTRWKHHDNNWPVSWIIERS